jgi:hypothetical protein
LDSIDDLQRLGERWLGGCFDASGKAIRSPEGRMTEPFFIFLCAPAPKSR